MNFVKILFKIQTFSFKKMHLNMSSGEWRPCCLSLKVLQMTKWKCHNGVETWQTNYFRAVGYEDGWVLTRGVDCWPGGLFKKAYELVDLGDLKSSLLNKLHIFQCTDKIFCVEFQRVTLKFNNKKIPLTISVQSWKFRLTSPYAFLKSTQPPPPPPLNIGVSKWEYFVI